MLIGLLKKTAIVLKLFKPALGDVRVFSFPINSRHIIYIKLHIYEKLRIAFMIRMKSFMPLQE